MIVMWVTVSITRSDSDKEVSLAWLQDFQLRDPVEPQGEHQCHDSFGRLSYVARCPLHTRITKLDSFRILGVEPLVV